MRLAAVFALALAAAPAFAQQAPPPVEQWEVDPKFAVPTPREQFGPDIPPPEGFYRDIPNAYDLLLRPQAPFDFSLVFGLCARPGPELKDGAARAAAEAYEACLKDDAERHERLLNTPPSRIFTREELERLLPPDPSARQ